jgi:hypothetical protein
MWSRCPVLAIRLSSIPFLLLLSNSSYKFVNKSINQLNQMKNILKTNSFILSIILIAVIDGCDSKTTITDVEKYGLNGKIKAVRTEYHIFSEKFGKIQIGPRWGWGEFYDWLFEKNGDLKEELQYNYNNELDFRQIYKKNETRTECVINTYNSDGDLDNKCVKEYDNYGKILKESYYNPDGQNRDYKIYKYNSKNQLIEELNYNEDGIYKNGQIHKYDERGFETEKMDYSSKEARDSNKGQRTIFKYNSKGRLIEEINLDDNGEISIVITYSYNSKAQFSERKEVTKDRLNNLSGENAIYKDLYEGLLEIRGKNNKDIYTKYDQKGNWIEQLKYKDGKPNFAIIRSIEYY